LIVPLIAVEEFLSSTFKPAAAEEENAKAVQAGAAPHAANSDPPVIDLSKANADNETAKGAAASSQAHTDQAGRAQLLAQPHEDAAKLNSEAGPAASNAGIDDDWHKQDHQA